MIVLHAYATVNTGHVDAAIDACRKVRAASVLEPGCERYDFFQSPDNPSLIVFVEEWTSIGHLETHFQQPAFNEFMAAMNTMLTGPAEIRIFEATLSN